MKLSYGQNPLKVIIELKDIHIERLRVSILKDTLIDTITELCYNDFNTPNVDIRKAFDMQYRRISKAYEDNDFEDELNRRLRYLVPMAREAHGDDCTSDPVTCMKCRLEEHLNMSTIEYIPKPVRRSIKNYFTEVGPGATAKNCFSYFNNIGNEEVAEFMKHYIKIFLNKEVENCDIDARCYEF